MTIDEPQQDDDPEVPVDGADPHFAGDPFFELGIAPSIVDIDAGGAPAYEAAEAATAAATAAGGGGGGARPSAS